MDHAMRLRIDLQPIDEAARDGRYKLLSDGREQALARWVNLEFTYPGGAPLDFVPTHYRPAHGLVAPRSARD